MTTRSAHRLPLHDHTAQPLSPRQFAALMDEAKARAVALRREASDAFWSSLGAAISSALSSALSHGTQRLWPQSRTPRKEASHVTGIPPRAVQNRPRGALRLLDS